jgi:hypothetical protein
LAEVSCKFNQKGQDFFMVFELSIDVIWLLVAEKFNFHFQFSIFRNETTQKSRHFLKTLNFLWVRLEKQIVQNIFKLQNSTL